MPNYTIRVTNKSGALIASPTNAPTITSQLSSQTMSGNGITSIQTSNGIVGGPITTTGTISVLANSGIIANSFGLFVNTSFIQTLSTNSATYLSTANLSNIETWITGNATSAYTNAVSYVDGKSYVNTSQLSSNLANYQTTSGLASNVATLTVNNATYLNGVSLTSINTSITSNAATAYTNAVNYVDGKSYVNTSQLSSNLANYQTTSGLASNVATLTSNSSTYLGNSSGTIANIASWITGNSATAYTNAVSYVDNKSYVNTSQLSSNLANYALLTGATFTGQVNATTLNTLGNTNIGGNITITGNLTIGGNVTVIGANNLSIVDNMIYLNSNSINTNPDLGFAGNYNDGSYHHAGFFRDHSSGIWKVFDNYDPEPDASPYIDQSNSSFRLANFQANVIYVGNNTSYATINTTNYSGTANNALYLGGVVATSYITTSQLSSNLANYQTTAGLSANVATLSSNSATYLGNSSGTIANIASWITGNATSAYTNTVNYVDGKSYVNTSQLSSNLANYQTTAGLSANVATLTSNNATYLNGELASYYTNASNITTGILPWNQAPTNTVNTTGAFTFANNIIFNSNLEISASGKIVISNGAGIYTNGSLGLAGQVLTSNSSGVYWSTISSGSGGFTNGQSISVNNFVITGSFTVNSTNGTSGQVLTSNGAGVYWSTISGSSGGTVTQINTGNGMIGGPITGSGTVSILANSGIIANTTGIFVDTSYIQSLTSNNATYAFGKSESALNVNNALTANSVTYLGTANLENIQTWITSNSGTAYTNATSYVDGKSYVNTSQLSSNLANYQTTAGLSANVATLTSNNATYAFGKSESALNVNNATYLGTANLENIQTSITSNSGTAYTNATSYVDSKSYVNTSQLSSNLSNYQTTAGLASNVATLAANSATYLGNSSGTIANIASWITSNSGTAYTNATSYVDSKSYVNTSQLSSNLANYALLTGATFTGNVRTQQNAQVDGNLTVSGNLTVTGNVTVIGANNLSVVDNMIYLNSNSTVSNPDIGFAANYNDGTYQHTGFFRDASDGIWKVFDSYLPEPDASAYIDTSNSSFHIANFQANIIYVGNTTVYSTVNTTSFTGTANNATYAFGKSESALNVNNATYLGTANLSNIQTWITGNSGTAYTNATSYVDSKSYVNTSQLSSNLVNYQTTAGLSANVATLSSNSATYLGSSITFGNSTGIYTTGTINAASLTVGTSVIANSSRLAIGTAVGLQANGGIGAAGEVLHSNGTTIYWAADDQGVTSVSTGNGLTGGPISTTGTLSVLANNGITANSTGLFVFGNTGLVVNATGVHVNATYIGTLAANSATYLGSVNNLGNATGIYTTGTINAASLTVGTSTIANSTGVYTGVVNGSSLTVGSSIIANTTRLVIGTAVGLQANGGIGASGQVLTSNATTVYWSTPTTGTVTSVSTGNGLTGGPISTTGTLSVLANNGITANSTGLFVFANTGLIANATGVHVNTTYVATQSGVETLSSKTLKNQSIYYFNSGTTSALDYTNGSHQRWAPAGTVSLSVTNWPTAGGLGELLIEGINLGSATITWPTINWIKSDGTTTTTFAGNGVTLQSTGTDWVFLWTRDGGTTVYGKIVR